MVSLSLRLFLTAALVGTIFAHAHWSVGVFAALSATNAEVLALVARMKRKRGLD